jgi:uncharacterized membrane protein
VKKGFAALWRWLAVSIVVAYPIAIWLGQERVEAKFLAVLLLIPLVTQHRRLGLGSVGRWCCGGVLILLIVSVWDNTMMPLKLYPVLVNVGLLGAFSTSLIFPPSLVERIARTREPDLPAQAVGYMRRVTQVWCVFFAVNGAVALATALWASSAVWSLYNGVVAYLLMGLLFAGEYLVRCRFKRRLNA